MLQSEVILKMRLDHAIYMTGTEFAVRHEDAHTLPSYNIQYTEVMEYVRKISIYMSHIESNQP